MPAVPPSGPVPKHGEHVLPARVQVQIRAIPRAVSDELPQVVQGVDSRSRQHGHEGLEFDVMAIVINAPQRDAAVAKVSISRRQGPILSAVDDVIGEGFAAENDFLSTGQSLSGPFVDRSTTNAELQLP